MLQGVKGAWMQMVTEDDSNQVVCYVRLLSILVGVALTGIMLYKAWADIKAFDLDLAGRAMLQYFVGVGGAIWAKTKSGA